MISNTKDVTLYTQDNEDDFQSQGYCIQPPDAIFSAPTYLNIPQQSNDNKFDLSLSLNNNYITPTLLINNFKGIEKFDSSVNDNTSIRDIKNRELPNFYEKNKKIQFLVDKTNLNSNKIRENKNNNLISISHLGRKRKSEKTIGQHNRFSDDNLRRKCKHIMLDNIKDFINAKIKKIYNGNIGKSIFKKELLTLNKNIKSDARIEFNQNFINKTLSEIFSDNISTRFTNFLPNHNKSVIEELINEEDQIKRIYFKKLFSITILKCLKHFRGEESYSEIEGMKRLNEIKEKLKEENEENEYIRVLEFYFNNFEDIINNKKPKKSKKTKFENTPKENK